MSQQVTSSAGVIPPQSPAGKVPAGPKVPPSDLGLAARVALERLGGMSALLLRALAAGVTPPFGWGRELLVQMVFMLRVTLIPVLLVNFFFGGGALGVGGPDLLAQLGALDRTASFAAPGLLREFGVFLTGAVMAGVTGTTMTAEFGARKIREELEALEVLGVDTIRYMIVPRIVALTLVGLIILMLGFIAGIFGSIVFVTLVHDSPTGAFLPQLLSNTSFVDLYGSALKTMLFGVMISVICCYKGLNASGGAEGVGRAVNEAVVASLFGVFFLSLIYTYLFLGIFPDIAVNR
ncbi:MAG TPA: ABC transporter permease [Baekduia sp.]|nr:ABC transporter permease [Baekduia sp.]